MDRTRDDILIVDDDRDILLATRLLLKRHFRQVDLCDDPENIPGLLASGTYAVILLDMNFGPGESSGAQGFQWLQQILRIDPEAIVVMITAHGDLELAVEAMKQGATDFVSKPWQNEKLLATLSTCVKLRHSRSETEHLKQTNRSLTAIANERQQSMLGESEAMQSVLSLIERAAPTDANVLVLGANGTGKELAAREIHARSRRADQVFLSVDLGAVAETLFESELFGHRKGAFTGADSDRQGKLAAANGGTLFLDEIGNLPLALQAKLLTVLEQRKVTPLGSNQALDLDVRVIAATNMPREQLYSNDSFRQDLLFRLNTVEIELPGLKERREDIPLIARHYAAQYCRKYHREEKSFSAAAMQAICQYDWPGNIRALRHAVERAVILSQSPEFEAEDFQLRTVTPVQPAAKPTVQPPAPVITQPEAVASVPADDDFNLDRVEKQTIHAALRKHQYNISHTAKALGLTRAALYRRMEKHGL